MRFTLDVRRARKGDCLLIHYGTNTAPGLVMIDGGPASVYGPHLKPRLLQIKKARGLAASDALAVDLLMVSHVDDDHIKGILDLTKEAIGDQAARRPQLLNVLDFWHNSFDALIDHNTKPLTATFTKQFGTAAASGGPMSDDDVEAVVEESEEDTEVIRSGLQVLASIEQGYQLRLDAERLEFPLNSEFDGGLIVAKPKTKPIDFGNGLQLTVVGPQLKELDALRADHLKWLQELKKKGKKPPSALAAYVDPSVPNLSSLVILAEAGGKRILLTGDARGDKILKGLELVGLLKPGKTMTVDVLKVPHHGSSNNLDNDFFERVLASHYVFSGDGEHGNPERESLEMLFKARGTAPFVIHLTYPVKDIDVERKKDWEKEQAKEKKRKAKKPSAEVRPDWLPKKHSLAGLFAATKLAAGQELRIVADPGPHVIDLLDPVKF